jgi:hypothetical protein
MLQHPILPINRINNNDPLPAAPSNSTRLMPATPNRVSSLRPLLCASRVGTLMLITIIRASLDLSIRTVIRLALVLFANMNIGSSLPPCTARHLARMVSTIRSARSCLVLALLVQMTPMITAEPRQLPGIKHVADPHTCCHMASPMLLAKVPLVADLAFAGHLDAAVRFFACVLRTEPRWPDRIKEAVRRRANVGEAVLLVCALMNIDAELAAGVGAAVGGTVLESLRVEFSDLPVATGVSALHILGGDSVSP